MLAQLALHLMETFPLWEGHLFTCLHSWIRHQVSKEALKADVRAVRKWDLEEGVLFLTADSAGSLERGGAETKTSPG